ncbi:DUF2167 domain-containing protein [Acinetobacter silvestris]|uniref:DUF2167 domain-containing protein n=1 Tax=Acinetobacter silvestris TaxID=1977882 RepID=A0A1Y3CPP2_9GAMM|nr:DUF2167 domain-containing protein [Acinetobacter silvestris]OTG67586.1 hypothetical protein B9T28_02895 [Acinetobacter silvestris]
MQQPNKPLKLKKLVQAISFAFSLTSITALPTSVFASESAPTEATQANGTQNNPLTKLDWHMGPTAENIANVAQLKTSKGEGFLDTKNSDQFLELTNNLPSGSTNILVADNDSWWATFDFEPSGYIKDDEKIDANALLKELKDSDEASNDERTRLGMSKLYTAGWAIPPHYDPTTKQLEWALKVRSEDQHENINYTVRLLGRTGVMSATLVSNEENLNKNIQAFKHSLEGFNFNSGQRYSEYKNGDKVAEYGLAALVTGGAVAVAAKKGLFATLLILLAKAWKLVIVAVIAVFGGFTSIFKRKKD